MEEKQAPSQYAELAREEDRLRLHGVLQIRLESSAKVFTAGLGHAHVLVRFQVGGVERWSRPEPLVDSGAQWDETLVFNLAVMPWQRHPTNLVRLTLFALLGDPDVPAAEDQLGELGAAIFHVHDIIKATEDGPLADTFLLWDDYQTVGELSIGVDFQYGELGRGQSERVAWDDEVAAAHDGAGLTTRERGLRIRGSAGEQELAECFESLYLAAATPDNELKAEQAGRARCEGFAQAHAELESREDRVAYVRHRLDASAQQLSTRALSKASRPSQAAGSPALLFAAQLEQL